jgi:hypothetical protein
MWHSSDEVTGAPHVGGEDQRFPAKAAVMDDQRFAVKTVFDYLRAKGKPVPTGKPQVVGHKVDISGLAKAAFEAGGRAQVPRFFCYASFMSWSVFSLDALWDGKVDFVDGLREWAPLLLAWKLFWMTAPCVRFLIFATGLWNFCSAIWRSGPWSDGQCCDKQMIWVINNCGVVFSVW